MHRETSPTRQKRLWSRSQDTLYEVQDNEKCGDVLAALQFSDHAKPVHMQYADVPEACATLEGSVDDDPLERYLQATPNDHPDSRRYRTGRRMLYRMQFYRGIWDRCAWTIHHGKSVIIINDPRVRRGPLAKILDSLYRRLFRGIRGAFQSKEQKQRSKEFMTKMERSVEEHIGDRLNEMFEIGSLVTAIEYRGRGYATALVRVATDLADFRGASTWLASSNTVNRGFYHSLGFQIIDTFYLGGENPSWNGKHIPIDIMVREPRGHKGLIAG